ncbi:phage tail assembly protein [Cupriavidus metallidurans]|jgi:Phage tail assembly chaperone proteins, E, or 41 or 14|uniref:Phage tail assembly protein n=1 Tax=Cupriavidus metallidurans TaxID=119219 RepID=A0A482ITF8_9BURK|nr:phage tail assembly protein [Cupriavidus metallidurans]QBP10120.1 phage tail assembly protein [Cupriavidus metallidurans]QWC87197.1 phage tail assembly protein [Cupriavidus metallidurans]
MKPTTTDIALDHPIKRGEQTIARIQVRKPGSGELRGCSLIDLLRMDVSALHVVLPRITMPTLTQHDVGQLDPADLMQLGAAVSSFLLTKSAKEDGFPNESSTPSPTLQ